MNAVERWFGKGFAELNPLLQQLHREGGVLSGTANIQYGRGIAGWLGKRLVSAFGIASGANTARLRVEIRSDLQQLYWNRVFDESVPVNSIFRPVGRWPDGYWIETTGALRLSLNVIVKDGGWYWHPFRATLRGLPVPYALLPQGRAYKTVENGLYVFYVGVSLPLLGLLFSYSGKLAPLDLMG